MTFFVRSFEYLNMLTVRGLVNAVPLAFLELVQLQTLELGHCHEDWPSFAINAPLHQLTRLTRIVLVRLLPNAANTWTDVCKALHELPGLLELSLEHCWLWDFKVEQWSFNTHLTHLDISGTDFPIVPRDLRELLRLDTLLLHGSGLEILPPRPYLERLECLVLAGANLINFPWALGQARCLTSLTICPSRGTYEDKDWWDLEKLQNTLPPGCALDINTSGQWSD